MWQQIIVTYVTQCYNAFAAEVVTAFGNECMHILESFFLEY